ncbi:bicyclomycin resistance protein [Leifsonia sp. Root4]|nr:bicyclomycin resistance protein [Leifsonia sp. Root4]
MANSLRRPRARWQRLLPEVVMTTPALVIFVGMFVIPTILAVYLSMTDWNGFSLNMNFIGVENYTELFNNPRAQSAALFTAVIAIVGTILCNVIGLGLAVLIAEPTRANSVIRTVLFYPHIISALIIGFLWSAMLSPTGIVNSTLAQLGIDAVPFLSDPTFAAVCVIATIVWATFGINLILYIAGIKSVPTEFYEAATVDGASKWQQFKSITFPMIAPIMTVNLIIVLVSLLRTYDLVLALTGGGPAGRTQTIVFQILVDSFQNGKLGFGSAQAVVLMIVTAVLGVVITLARRRAEEKVTD